MLEPGEHQGQRQIVDAALERLGQRQCQLDGGVGIVALAHVQQTGNAADVAEIELVELVLAAAQGEQQAVLGGGLGKLGKVGALGLVAVTTAHQEEMADLAGLDLVDHRGGGLHQGVAGKAYGDEVLEFCVFEAIQRLRLRYHGGEVIPFQVSHARPADDGAGEDAVAVVAHVGIYDAVGGHHHGAGEVGELLLLVLPGGAVVAHQMRVLLEEGIGQRRQHLAVGVDIDAGTHGLLQDQLEIHHVVA